MRGSQRAGCGTASRYHVGSRVRRGQPLGAEVLLVVPTAGRKRFAVSSLDCSHAHALSVHCHGYSDFDHRYRTKEYEERTDRTTGPFISTTIHFTVCVHTKDETKIHIQRTPRVRTSARNAADDIYPDKTNSMSRSHECQAHDDQPITEDSLRSIHLTLPATLRYVAQSAKAKLVDNG